MNWKIILTLSISGILIAFASVLFLPQNIEMILWILIFIFNAIIIVKRTESRYFLNGLLVSTVNGVWIGIIHSAFLNQYLSIHPDMLAQYNSGPKFLPINMMMLVMGPIIGTVFGLISGLFAFIAGKIIKK